MRTFLSKLGNRGKLWLQRISEVARCEGIILADLRDVRSQSPHFRDTLLASLRLLQGSDMRRFKRIQRHIAWITNCPLPRGGAEYASAIRTCYVEFQEPNAEFDVAYLIGCYACTLVHEATHAVICSRGIHYTAELRERIERACFREEQRFIRRLSATDSQLATRLTREFDARDWNWYWGATPFERFSLQITRALEQ